MARPFDLATTYPYRAVDLTVQGRICLVT